MPAIPNRDKLEALAAASIARLQSAQRQRLAAALGSGLDAAKVSASEWERIERETAEALAGLLLPIYLGAAGRLSSSLAEPADFAAVNADARAWATSYATKLAADMTANTKAWVEAATEKRQKELAIGIGISFLPSAALAPILGPSRASAVAVTEITRAGTAGESAAAERANNLAASTGRGSTTGTDGLRRILVPIWQTAEDDRVCPVCAPLDNTRRELWPDELGEGPPAHPNCRCYLRWQETFLP